MWIHVCVSNEIIFPFRVINMMTLIYSYVVFCSRIYLSHVISKALQSSRFEYCDFHTNMQSIFCI